ncbi:MAG: hypothetical protein ACK5PS_10090 [Desulfopila sp.]
MDTIPDPDDQLDQKLEDNLLELAILYRSRCIGVVDGANVRVHEIEKDAEDDARQPHE